MYSHKHTTKGSKGVKIVIMEEINILKYYDWFDLFKNM